jgi:putative ABC transport system permease protein
MAARFWPSEDPLGKRLKVGGQFAGWREIIGVVGDVRHFGPARQPDPEMYVPYLASNQPWREMTLVVRTSSDPARLAAAVRREVRSIDEDQPVYNIRAIEQLLSGSLSRQRFLALLLEVFAVLALVLAAIGVYSVMSYSVTQQTREIGIRIALGGSRADVLGLVIGRGMVLALIGVGAGIVAAVALTRLISSLLYGIRPNDPATFAAVVFGLVGVTALASYIPARRATKFDPMVALRDE